VKKKLKILHLEDVGSDAVLVNNQLKKCKLDCEILVVDTKTKFIKELKKFSPDIILADHSLPSFNSHEALAALHETGFKIPFILVTATMSDELAVDVIMKGADDYILKDRLNRLPGAILDVLEKYRLKSAREIMVDELISSQLHLKEAQAIAHLGSWELDYSTGTATWSDEQLKIYGLPPEDSKQSFITWTSYIHPEDLDNVLQKTNKTKTDFDNSDFCHRIIKRDGTVRHIHSQTRVKFNKKGIPIGLYGTMQDVTKRTEAEESLKKSEANLKAIFENTSDGFILADINGIIKFFNSKTRDRIRLNTEQEIKVGKSIYEFLPDSRKKMYKDNISKVLSGEIWQYDYSYTRKNGETKWFSFTINPVHNAEKIEGFSITSTDISERKSIELKLHDEEAQMRDYFENAPEAILVMDMSRNGTFRRYNNNALKLFKFQPEEFYSKTPEDISPVFQPDGRRSDEKALELINLAMAGNKPVFEWLNLDAEGNEILCEVRLVRLSGYNGNHLLVSIIDITERKIAENKLNATSIELKKALTDINKILDSSLDVICTINAKGEFMKVSAASQQVWGYAPQELIGSKYMDLVYPEDAAFTSEAAGKIAIDIQVPAFENRYLHKSGRVVFMLWSINWDEKLQLMFCIAKDVTEKKKLEKAIKTERDQFFKMFLNAPAAIGMLKGADHVFEMTNQPYLQLIGKKDVIGKPLTEVLPEIIEQGFIDILDSVYTTGKSYKGTEVLVKLDKEGNGKLTDAYLNFIYQAYKNDEGNIEGVFFFANDITEQIQSRKAIEKSEKFFKGVIESSDDMITILSPTGETIYASPAVSKKFGYTNEECLNLNLADVVHREDALMMQEFVMKIITHPSIPLECPSIRNRKKDGTYIWVEGTLTNFLETEGINAIVANFRDVTERKKAEDENRFKANLLNTIGQAAIATDMQGLVNYWNKAAEQIYGWTKEEAIGKNIIDLTPSEATVEQGIEIMEKLKRGQTWSGEFKVRKKDGTNFPAHVTDSPIYDENNILSGIIGISSDITEKKKLEDLLDKSNTLARLGNWEVDLVKNTIYWSDITKQIHEVADNFIPDLETAINYYKPGLSRETINNAIRESIENNTPFDVELQIVTAKGNERWIRAIGEAECIDGKCIRLFGSFQDIDVRKIAEIEILKAYEEKDIILESIGDGFFAVDNNWVITYWNNQAEKMLGRSKLESIGKDLWEIYSHNLDTPFHTYFNKAVKENTVQHFEAYSQKLDTWYDLSAYPNANGLSVYFKDKTQQRLAEQQIKSERNLLRTLIDNIPDAIYVKDTAARKLISNKFDYTFMGAATEEEVLGKTDLELLPRQIAEIHYSQDSEILRTGKPFINVEEYFTTADNESLCLLTSKLPLRNANNEITGLLGIGRDITQRKIAEEKLLELNAALEKNVKQLVTSNAELAQFAYVASHDLQEPLRMVTNFLKLLEVKYSPIIDKQGKQYIEFAVGGGIRMRQIILDLLEFSRVGRTEDKLENVDLNDLVNGILSLQSHQIEELNAVIKVEQLPSLTTYKSPLRQVFQNLVNNGLKYHREGVIPQISISVSSAGELWQFAVSDNGIGIGEEYFDKIFIIFQRLHNKEKYSGTGIGLSITKKL
jgi:PAS domain S-box-containing protein